MQALADRVGCTKSMIASVEYGKRRPSPELARKIADAVGVEVAAIWQMFY